MLESVDPLYQRMEEAEKEIKNIKQRIKQITRAYDGAIANLKLSIIETQRYFSSMVIIDTHDLCTMIDTPNIKPTGFNSQLASETAATLKDLETTDEPMRIAKEFRIRQIDKLKKLGVTTVGFR